MVAAKPKKSSLTWNDVKGKVADFDRAGLVGLLQALYGASKDNRAFLHARLGLGADPLEPFKVTIKRWLWPDVLKDQSTSVSTAKKAIADYKAATGQSEGLAELTVFYCECAAGFSNSVGYEDGVHFDALMRMFEQAPWRRQYIGCAIGREDEFPAAAPADRNRHARRPAVAFAEGSNALLTLFADRTRQLELA